VKLLVLGGGVAGLATALAAGRAGHDVVLVERDTDSPVGVAARVFESWQRTGVAQFRQPHNFLGLGRRLLRERIPDVYRALLRAGAVEVEQFRFLAGAAPEPGDEDLATIGSSDAREVHTSIANSGSAARGRRPGVESCTRGRVGTVTRRCPRPAAGLGTLAGAHAKATGLHRAAAPSLHDALRSPITDRRDEQIGEYEEAGPGSVQRACDTTRRSTVSHGPYWQRSSAGQRRRHDHRYDSQADNELGV
jgi:phytoene dehydrogenase-like protein